MEARNSCDANRVIADVSSKAAMWAWGVQAVTESVAKSGDQQRVVTKRSYSAHYKKAVMMKDRLRRKPLRVNVAIQRCLEKDRLGR